MSNLWRGTTMADGIGRQLERRGFAPFGLGVPFEAQTAALAWLERRLTNHRMRALITAVVVGRCSCDHDLGRHHIDTGCADCRCRYDLAESTANVVLDAIRAELKRQA